ncbi:hypothetical protein LINPERPRIM_LOCUS38849 [Linum perenne]
MNLRLCSITITELRGVVMGLQIT